MLKARTPAISSKLAALLKRKRRMRTAAAEDEHPLIGIQRSAGNEATMRMLQDGAQKPQEEQNKDSSKLADGAMAIWAAFASMDKFDNPEETGVAAEDTESQSPADAELETLTPGDLAIDALPKLSVACEPARTPDYERYMSPYSQEHDTQGGYGGLESTGALPSISGLTTLFGYDLKIPGEPDKETEQRDEKKDSVLSELNASSIADEPALDEGLANDESDSSPTDREQADAVSEHPGKEQEELQRARETNAKRILKQQKARRRLELLQAMNPR